MVAAVAVAVTTGSELGESPEVGVIDLVALILAWEPVAKLIASEMVWRSFWCTPK